MRKLAFSLAAATALTFATAANAAITVNNSSGVTLPITVVNDPAQSTVDWKTNPTPSGSFSGWLEFTNTLSGLYSIIVSTSTPFASITGVSLTGVGGSPSYGSVTGSAPSLNLLVGNMSSGDYRVAFSGTAPANGGVLSGNLTFIPVPEPASWALMLVGFAGIGMAMRRRRPRLAQVA
jgi:hypothetical protein